MPDTTTERHVFQEREGGKKCTFCGKAFSNRVHLSGVKQVEQV